MPRLPAALVHDRHAIEGRTQIGVNVIASDGRQRPLRAAKGGLRPRGGGEDGLSGGSGLLVDSDPTLPGCAGALVSRHGGGPRGLDA